MADTTRSYCLDEHTDFSCPIGEVIVMTSAKYGRMETGRCISETFPGTIGCGEDILDILDGQCSGKTTCSMEIEETDLNRNNPCHKELYKYLDAAYICERGNKNNKTISDILS